MPAASPASLLAKIGPVLRIVADGLVHRGELAALEIVEARDHLMATLLAGVAAGVLALLAGFTATFTLAALVWDSPNRVKILGLVALVELLGVAAVASWVAHRIRSWKPMAESRHQLNEDSLCLKKLLPLDPP